MSPKFNFEIVLIYFLLLIPWPHTQVMKLLCSKDNSRLVRKIVRSKWTPILDKYQVKLPPECPLHPFRDLFAPRQDAKKRDRPTQWTCRLCGKSFYQEKTLDLHFETRHKNIINDAEDAVCLADYCDIMRCEVFQTEDSLKIGDQIVTDIEVWGDSLGQNSALAKANAAYLSLLPIRASSSSSRAANRQNRQLCHDKLTSQNLNTDTPHPQTSNVNDEELVNTNSEQINTLNDATVTNAATQPNIPLKATSNSPSMKYGRNQEKQSISGKSTTQPSKTESEKSEADVLNATANDNKAQQQNDSDNGNGNGNNIQKARANCKAEELSKLKVKCEYLVRSCIASLLLSMNNQAFKELEEEMNKAVCWYLSCDRYWEDGPLEPRAFPWGLIFILIFILSTGICFCYYIIWILFDTEETTINSNHHIYMPVQQRYQQDPLHYPTSTITGIHNLSGAQQHQQYYYQQQEMHDDLYPEPQQYEYRHSPRRYIGDQRQQGTPTTTGGQRTITTTPLHRHHQTNLGYQQDILDRRDYISSRPIATTAVTGHNGSNSNLIGVSTSVGSNTNPTMNTMSSTSTQNLPMGPPMLRRGDSDTTAIRSVAMDGSLVGTAGKHYNTLPRQQQAETHHRHTGASQQSLRGSSSTHEIIQNEIGQNDHYIYVTYPPDLKKRYFE